MTIIRIASVTIYLALWLLTFVTTAIAQSILEGARKEGQVVFYASMETASAQKLTSAFEKKYPFIKVDATRIGSERMATRLVAEAQARKVRADVVQQSAFDFYGGLQKGLFDSYLSPERAALPPDYRDDKGLWVMPAATLNVIAYNKKMVSAADAPKSFWDLVEPKWKGQLLMDENESKWMAGMISYYGEAKTMELMRKLAGQAIQFRVGHSLLQTLLAAGERAVVVVAFANGVDRLKKDGAPVDWIESFDPIVCTVSGMGLSAKASNPNAAKLLINFATSKQGQQMVREMRRIPVRSDIEPLAPKMDQTKLKLKAVPKEVYLSLDDNAREFRKIFGL